MKYNAAFFRLSIVLAAVVFAGAARSARAESDFEYVKLLMEQPYFTDDLVQRQAARLDESATPTAKLEAMMIKAAFKRRKAADATVEKRAALLKEASELYKDVVASNDKKFRLYETAVKDSDSINMDILTSQLDNAKSNPAEAKKYRAEAGAMFDKKATAYKDEAEKAYPEFQAALKRYNDEIKKLNPKGDENKQPGPAFLDALDKAFYAWNVPDRRYVAMKVKQVDVLDETDPDRKRIVTEMVAHCKKRLEDEVMGDFPALMAQYSYCEGSLFAAIGNEDEAAKAWNEALELDISQQPEGVKKQVISIFKLVIHDLVKMKMKSKKYSDVEEIILKIRTGPMRPIFDEDMGKDMIIEYAKALTILAESPIDYEKAVKELRTAAAKERAGSQWANDFSRAMAEILIDARNKKITPHLTAEEWYDAAHGMHLMGRYIYTQEYEKLNKSDDPKDKEKAQIKFQESYKEFANAVDHYRRAIAEARRSDHTNLVTRLNIEPKAWFEMGLSYVRMNHDYEAIIAYKAMRDSFLPENRKKWMPDEKRIPKDQIKAVKAALDVLDLPKEKDGMLAKSGSNIIFAVDANEKVHKDPWNIALKAKIIDNTKGADGAPLDPDSPTDQDYIIADSDDKGARSFAESAKKAAAEGKAGNPEALQNAGDLWKQALAKHLSAAEKFAKVKPTSTAYDFALVHCAYSWTQAQKIVSDGLVKMDPKDAEKQGKELAQKALDAYQKYDEYLAKTPSTDEKVLARRKKAQGTILLAKNSLYIGAGNWEQTVKTADEYIAFEAENPQPKSSAHIAYLNKFRALLSQAATTPAPESDPYLKSTLAALRDFRAANSSDNKLFVFMLNVLSDRYNVAAFQLEKLKKTKSDLTKEMGEKYDELIDLYENKVAELQGERVDMLEESSGDDLTLDDYSRLVYLFNKTGQTRKAADIAIKLLKKFDPNNKNMRMADDEKVWGPFLKSMQRVINYQSINKQERCVKEHSVLVDYMYDTDAGVQLKENDPRRPATDQLNQNMEKALAKLESIKNPAGEFKDCATLTVGPTAGGKSYLAIVEEEIQFRRKILAARDLLSEVSLVVAKKLRAEGKEDASLEYMKVAKEQIEILKDFNKGGSAIEIKVAEIDIALGKTQDAMVRLINVAPKFDPASAQYFYVKRLISELYAEQKKWTEAVDFPSFVFVTQGFNSEMVKKRWPDMRAFLKKCEENGAKLPPAVKKALDAKVDDSKQPDAPKTDTPVPETPKADAPKTDAPKADAPKDAPKTDAVK